MEMIYKTEAISLLGIKETTFRYWMSKGVIPHKRVGRYNVFDRQKLLDLKSDILEIEDCSEKIKKEKDELEKQKNAISEERKKLREYSVLSKIYDCNWRDFIEKRLGEKRREYVMLLDYLDGATFYDIAEKWDLTKARTQQIVSKGIRILRASWPDVQEIKSIKEERDKLLLENKVLKQKLKKIKVLEDTSPKNPLPAIFLTKVQDINWSIRVMNCLRSADVDTIGDLCKCKYTSLLTYRNFGKKSLREVVEKLDEMGLELGMDLSIYDYDTKL